MLTFRRNPRRPFSLAMTAALLITILPATPVAADSTAQAVPFAQDWTDTGQITTNDDWAGVPGVVGFLGQNITAVTGADPQTLLTESAVAPDVDAIANQTNPGITNGGVAEFEISAGRSR